MIPARGWLHLGALAIPLLAAVAWTLLLFRDDPASGLLRSLYFVLPAALAAQIAAALRWRALEGRVASGDAWKTGLGMAAITHGVFGLLLALALVVVVGPTEWLADGSVWNLFGQAAFFALASLGAAGAISFPVTALLAQRIAALRARELAG